MKKNIEHGKFLFKKQSLILIDIRHFLIFSLAMFLVLFVFFVILKIFLLQTYTVSVNIRMIYLVEAVGVVTFVFIYVLSPLQICMNSLQRATYSIERLPHTNFLYVASNEERSLFRI